LGFRPAGGLGHSSCYPGDRLGSFERKTATRKARAYALSREERQADDDGLREAAETVPSTIALAEAGNGPAP
jgi:hypothetical protein